MFSLAPLFFSCIISSCKQTVELILTEYVVSIGYHAAWFEYVFHVMRLKEVLPGAYHPTDCIYAEQLLDLFVLSGPGLHAFCYNLYSI